MNPMLDVVALSGSLRRKSANTGLLRAAQQLAPPEISIEIAEIGDLPLYNADLVKPHSVERLVARIAAADALLFACPEYNYSISAPLKNALDWVSREPGNRALDGKPAAILGAGGRMGGARAQYHLRQVCVYLNLYPLNKPEVFAHANSESFDADGNLVDERVRKQIAEQMEAFAAWARLLRDASE